jgi:Flp pilus assembly protein TadD
MTPPDAERISRPHGPEWQRFLPGGALVCLVLIAYIPALAAGWVWDDDDHVTNNEALRSVDGLRRIWSYPGATPQYYPLVFSTFWVEYNLFGNNATPYHLANVLLHGLNAWLVWRILVRLQVPGAWFAAAVFALHPVHVESVAWVTERKNVLSGMLSLAAILAYLHSLTARSRGWYLVASAAFLAALLSKTVACTLPAVLVLLTWWRQGRVTRRDWLLLGPWFAAGLGFGILTIWVEKHYIGASGPAWSLSATQRFLIASAALTFYAGKLAWPWPLIFVYPRWQVDAAGAKWYVALAAVVVVVVGLSLLRHRLGRGPLVAVLLFAGTLFPALGFFDIYPFRYSFVADHFQYLASVPLIALAASAGACLLAGRRAAPVLAGGLLVALAALTCRRTMDYASEQTLWEDTLAKHADCSVAHARLGIILFDEGRYRAAAEHLREVVRLNPDSVMDRFRLANLLARTGRREEAVVEYRALLARTPDWEGACLALVKTLSQLGRHDEAATEIETMLREHPDSARLHFGLGIVRAEQGQVKEAIEHLSTAERLDPTDPLARRALEALRRTGHKP